MPPIDRAKLATALAQLKAPKPAETPEHRRARQDRDVMRAAEAALAAAGSDPARVKSAIDAMRAAREFCGENRAAGSSVTVVIEGMDEPEEDDERESTASHQVQ